MSYVRGPKSAVCAIKLRCRISMCAINLRYQRALSFCAIDLSYQSAIYLVVTCRKLLGIFVIFTLKTWYVTSTLTTSRVQQRTTKWQGWRRTLQHEGQSAYQCFVDCRRKFVDVVSFLLPKMFFRFRSLWHVFYLKVKAHFIVAYLSMPSHKCLRRKHVFCHLTPFSTHFSSDSLQTLFGHRQNWWRKYWPLSISGNFRELHCTFFFLKPPNVCNS